MLFSLFFYKEIHLNTIIILFISLHEWKLKKVNIICVSVHLNSNVFYTMLLILLHVNSVSINLIIFLYILFSLVLVVSEIRQLTAIHYVFDISTSIVQILFH